MTTIVQTMIAEVTVFSDRALIVRRGLLTEKLYGDTGEAEMIIDGLPLMLEDTSVRVRFEGKIGHKIHDIRIGIVRRDDRSADELIEHDDDEQRARTIAEQATVLQAQRLVVKEIMRWLEMDMPSAPIFNGRPQEKPPFPMDAWKASVNVLTEMLSREQKLLREQECRYRDLLRERSARRDTRSLPEKPSVEDPARRWSKRLSVKYSVGPTDEVSTGEDAIIVSYTIRGANWAPCYKLNLEETGAKLDMGIKVVQFTGEDWLAVRLKCSAASLSRHVQLPDLPSRLIGRAQQPPPPSFRAPTTADDNLFSGFVRWNSQTPPPRPPLSAEVYPDFVRLASTLMGDGVTLLDRQKEKLFSGDTNIIDLSEKTRNRSAYTHQMTTEHALPPPDVAPMMKKSAPQAPSPQISPRKGPSEGDAKLARKLSRAMPSSPAESTDASPFPAMEDFARAPAFGAGPSLAATMSSMETMKDMRPAGEEDGTILQTGGISMLYANMADYCSFVIKGPDDSDRGALVQQPQKHTADPEFAEALKYFRRGLDQLMSPGPKPDNSFFHVFQSPANVDVLADGAIYHVSMNEMIAAATIKYVSAPLVDSKVFRVLNVSNPFDFPLPAGDVAFYRQGTFICRTSLERTDRGGTIQIPLGVEEGITIRRNVRFAEEQSGMISSATILVHHIEIDVKSQLTTAVTLDILDRIPVTNEEKKTIDIDELNADPVPQAITAYEGKVLRGGRLFTISLEPGEKKVCRHSFRITIPSKMELVGGNRRG